MLFFDPDYFINLSIFSLLVSLPFIILSFSPQNWFKHIQVLGGIYAGFVSIMLMNYSIRYEGYVYDIRYVPLILTFVYLGRTAGCITGIIILLDRLYTGGNWAPAIVGWCGIISVFLGLATYLSRLSSIKKSVFFFISYTFVYLCTMSIFSIVRNNLLFHVEYLLFILVGLFLGVLIIESYQNNRKMEERLRRSEKLSVVGELAAGIAHEIRNPLTTLKGFVYLLKRDNPQFKYMELLSEELDRIEFITNGLLSLARPQAVEFSKKNVTDLIDSTIELLTPQANMSNIQIMRESLQGPLFIQCDENQLKQVLVNIFKNAIEAMPNGGIIEVLLKKEGTNHVLISIQDQGCGIPAELLPRLGEPFYTLKEKGTGLGLMISQKIIKEHHGSISFKSMVHQGTQVKIQLPLASEV